MKKILGWFLISIPFLLMALVGVIEGGWCGLLVVGGIIVFALLLTELVCLGVKLTE